MRRLDLVALADYPTDMGITHAALCAFGHAESFFGLLGVSAANLNDTQPQLLGIQSWYHDEETPSDSEDTLLCDIESDNKGDNEDFQSAIDALEEAEMDSLRDAEVLMSYRYASVALSVDDDMKM
jgi:hypothetical protein